MPCRECNRAEGMRLESDHCLSYVEGSGSARWQPAVVCREGGAC